jgi:hypothetical protein
MNIEVPVEGAEHIELELEDLFVDDAGFEAAPKTERLGSASSARTWGVVGVLVGLGCLGVAALLIDQLRPPRWKRALHLP